LLSQDELKVSRLQQQLSVQTETCLRLQQRLDSLESSQREQESKHSLRVSQLEAELEEARGQAERRRGSDCDKYEEILARERDK
jgi:hypothetical protein